MHLAYFNVHPLSPTKEKKTHIGHHLCSSHPHLEAEAQAGGAGPAAGGSHVLGEKTGVSATVFMFPHPGARLGCHAAHFYSRPQSWEWTHSASLPGMKAQGGQHLRESSQIHSEAEKHSSTERAREDYRPLCFNVLKQIFGLPSPSKCHGVWGALGIWHVPPTSPHQLSVQLSIPPVNTTAWIVVVCPESPAQSSLPERDMQSYDGQL